MADYLSEASFRATLRAAIDAESSVADLERDLRPFLINHVPSPEPVTQEELLISWAFSLDAFIATSDPPSVRQLAATYLAIFDSAVDLQTRARLACLAERAERFVQVGARYLDGHLTRTGWVSFVTELPWPSDTKVAILALDGSGLASLLAAFRTRNYDQVRSLV